MATENQNRSNEEGNTGASRTGISPNEVAANRNLTDGSRQQRTVGDDNNNTAGDTSDPKGSNTSLRKEEKEARPNYNAEK